MKKEYLIEQSKLIRIKPPEDFNDLIGKYYLYKLKNGRNCFYRITGFKHFKHNSTILLYSALNGTFPYRHFPIDNLPPFYEMVHIDRKIDRTILFNIFE